MRNSSILMLCMALMGAFCPHLNADSTPNLPAPLIPAAQPESPKDIEFNTVLMKSTYMIASSNKTSLGTCFLMLRPGKKDPTMEYNVLITAGHVLEGFPTQTAIVTLRKQNGDGSYTSVPWSIPIRDSNNKPLWTKKPDTDVAVMYVRLPKDIQQEAVTLTTTYLGGDNALNRFGLHPGDQLFCLGYPYGMVSPTGSFPILRGGTIASYPLTPAKTIKQIYYDFNVFPGNSGGPVYFTQVNREYDGTIHYNESAHFIVGIVTESHVETHAISGANAQLLMTQPLSLASIVPSQFVLDTIGMLPDIPATP